MILGQHLPCFEEINDAVEAIDGKRTVVFGAAQHPELIPPGAIVYNLDLLYIHCGLDTFGNAPIWDAYQRNVEAWHRAGRPDVKHVPIGYHPSMHRFERKPPGKRDIDVAFFGSLNPRRRLILDRLKSFDYEVLVQFDSTRSQRDEVLSRTRVALNLRFYEDAPIPVLRSAHLISNRVPMVCEESSDEPDRGNVPYGDLVNMTRICLGKSDDYLDDWAESRLKQFQEHPLILPE